ncbi:MAG TPA: LuxR C-terminal-related transcriptional regulator [Candidatus Saccharimonadales bacterium]|nr:LuxR C-terminal-related transcriptional regulator [Candidatus Saccharimonadales bacterium]
MREASLRQLGKLEPPVYPFEIVETDVIRRLLDFPIDGKVTLIEAPVGYGKSVAMSAIYRNAKSLGVQTAWVRLDERDVRLESVAGLISLAIDRISPQNLDQQPAPGPINREDPFDVALEQLASLTRPVILFLDDLDCCQDSRLDGFINQVILDTSPCLSVWISTARYINFDRVRAQLEGRLRNIEIDDLKLDAKEVRLFLGGHFCSLLSDPEIQLILEKTEGWPLAVRMLKMTIERSERPFEAVAQYGGTDVDISALLRRQLFRNMDAETEQFFLEIAFFPTVSVELCQYATGEGNTAKYIEWLVEHDRFLLPLDRNHRSFRVHGLVRQFLIGEAAKRLGLERRKFVLERAAEWSKKNANWQDAIEFALAAPAPQLASGFLDELAATWVGQRGGFNQYIAWVQRLRASNASLSIEAEYWYLWSLLFTRQQQAAYVQAELLWNRLGTEEDLIRYPERQLEFRKRVEEIRIGVSVFLDRLGVAGQDAMSWMRDQPERTNEISIATVACSVALNAISNFEFNAARSAIRTAQASVAAAESSYGASWVALLSALTDIYEGQYAPGYSSLKTAIARTSEELGEGAHILATMSLPAAQCALEVGLIVEARAHLELGLLHMRAHGLSETAFCGLETALKLWNGDEEDVLSPAHMGRLIDSYPPPISLVLGCFAIQRLLRLGRIEDALHQCECVGLKLESGDPEIPVDPVHQTAYIRDLVSFTQMDLLYSVGSLKQSEVLCAAMTVKADQQRRRGRTVELEIMAALLSVHSENSQAAVRHLFRAIRYAAKRRVVYPFLNRAEALGGVIRLANPKDWVFAEKEEHALFEQIRSAAESSLQDCPAEEHSVSDHSLLERLTSRELELLHLIEAGMSNQQIADRTGVSLSTVKWHLYNLYAKFNVRSRSAAIAKARSIRLV